MKITTKNTFFRFFAALCIIAMMLVITAGKCKPKGGDDDKKDTTGGGGGGAAETSKACTDGFKIDFANDNLAKAFTAADFVKDGDGSFNTTVDVDVKKMTHANGFVSNHAWISTDAKQANAPFVDMGMFTPPTASAPTAFDDAVWAANTATTFSDYEYCGAGQANGTTTTTINATVPNTNRYFAWIALHVADGAWKTSFDFDGSGNPLDNLATSAATTAVVSGGTSICKDYQLKGAVIDRFGHAVQGMYAANGTSAKDKTGTSLAKVADSKTISNFYAVTTTAAGSIRQGRVFWTLLESEIDKVGAYYIRRNGNLFYDEIMDKETVGGTISAGGAALVAPTAKITGKVGDGALKSTPIVHANNTDKLYDEVQDFFKEGGVGMAALTAVFPLDANVTIKESFTKQPKGTGDNAANMSSAAGGLGTVEHGGWQKLFTIKPCLDKVHVNGFAVAQYIGTKEDGDAWAKKPYALIDAKNGTAMDKDFEKKVKLRQGTHANNQEAIIFESVASPAYQDPGDLGLFTVQHDTLANLTDNNKMAFTTKATLHCRSSVVLEKVASSSMVQGHIDSFLKQTNDKSIHNSSDYAHKMVGYRDAIKDDKTKGLGMTCYLGLSAVWPDAISESPKAKALYKTQFTTATDQVDTQYDTEAKTIGVAMVSVGADAKINDEGLRPLFSDQLSSDVTATKGEIVKKEGEDAFEAFKKADSKVKLLHGVVTVKFTAPPID